MTKIKLLDIPIQNILLEQAVDNILDDLRSHHTSTIYFINAHCVNIAATDHEYREIVIHNHCNYADGIGMKLAANFFGISLVDNVNGTDLFPLLCRALQESGYSVYLLGAAPERLRNLVQNLKQDYPSLRIAGYHHGYFSHNENQQVIEQIRSCEPDVLLAAMGVPIQEKWIHIYSPQLGVPVMMGVGGLFDFYSGAIPRAPQWMRRIGLEWLYRFYQEPSRLWRRYLIGNMMFLMRVIYQRIRCCYTD